MPAQSEEIEAARAEGVALRLLTNPVAVLEAGGRARGLRCVTMALGEPDASGRRRPEPLPGSEHELEADTIIFAIGQQGDADAARRRRGDRPRRRPHRGRRAADNRARARLRGGGRGARARQRDLGDGRGAARGAGRSRGRQRRDGRAARLDAHRLRPLDAAARRDRQGRAPEGPAHRDRAPALRLHRGRGALPREGRHRRGLALSAVRHLLRVRRLRRGLRRGARDRPRRHGGDRSRCRCSPPSARMPPSRLRPAPRTCSSTARRRTRPPCSIGCATTRARRCRRGAGRSPARPGSTSFSAPATIPCTTGT